jgi:hypothetical protein
MITEKENILIFNYAKENAIKEINKIIRNYDEEFAKALLKQLKIAVELLRKQNIF